MTYNIQDIPAYTDLLRDSLKKHANHACFHIKRENSWRTWTYEDFHAGLNKMTSALKKKGFSKGDKGLVIGENGPEWIIAYHSFFLAGGCTIPVDPHLPPAEIQEIIRLTKASYIACSKTLFNLFEQIKSEMPSVKKIIVLDEPNGKNDYSFNAFCSTGNTGIDALETHFSPEDPAMIIFTSGTTGRSKGVVLNQRNFVTGPIYGTPRMKINSNDTMLAVLPLNHVFGAAACIATGLCTGIDLVFVASIKASVILEAMCEKHVTILPAVPKMIGLFYNSIERTIQSKGFAVKFIFFLLKFLSATLGPVLGNSFRKKLFSSVHATFGGKLNLMISGGASLQKKHFNAFLNMGFSIVEGYGLTETFGPITLCPGDNPKLGSVGPVLSGNEIKILNPDSSGTGEVLFRGAGVFPCYYDNKEQTDQVLDSEGWFHTGDLGRLDKDGFLFLSGRIKDLIVLESGKNAYPDELEDYYLKSELIEEIGVFGVKIKDKEIIAALIVPADSVKKSNSPEKAGEIIYNEIVRMGRNLPSYKKLTDFRVVYEPLPRTTTLKLKKHELKQIYNSHRREPDKISPVSRHASLRDNALLSTREYAILTGQIFALFDYGKHKRILPSHNLELDIGLDSLKRVELFCRLEETFSIVFPEETLFEVQTVGDLYTLIMELKSAANDASGSLSRQTLRQRLTSATISDVPLPARSGLLSNAIPKLTFTLSKALWNVTVEGVVDFLPGEPVIFCSNHQSYLDILWLMYALPESIRDNTFITGKSEIADSRILSPFIKNTAFIPIERNGDFVKALRLSIAVLKKGKNIIIFPEGSRSRTGELNPFKAGVGLLMLETNAAVVPVRIRGAYDIWPAGKLPKFVGGRRYKPSITFGEKFTLQKLIELGKLSPYSTDVQIADCIRDIVEKM
jgi:long-chain acyl-CoA synthetase